MAAKSERTPGKKKQPAAVETSESIAAQTAAFLAAGGEIERVDSGVSGNPGSYAPRASQNQK